VFSSLLPIETNEPKTQRDSLNLSDRCDSCGAQAFVAVTMSTGSELLFCGHHFNKYESVLASKAGSVHDERDRINAKPSISANAV